MKDNPFLLVSLKDDKTKKLAQVINNDTARLILEYLASHKSATETKVAKDLDIALSTVHYNLKSLVESRLVKADEFHYSKKGKEVNHYSLANKFVIIAQDEEKESILQNLKKILPAFVTVIAGTALMYILSFFAKRGYSGDVMLKSTERAFDAAPMAAEAMMAEPVCPVVQEPNLIMWFVLGACFAFASFLFWEWVRRLIK